MTGSQRELIQFRMEKARQSLAAAKNCLDNGLMEIAASRIYYAVFYAATALLLTKGLSSSKHTGIITLLGREFVKTGLLEEKYGKFLSKMFDRRMAGDYQDFIKFEKAETVQWLNEANEFLDKAVELLKNKSD